MRAWDKEPEARQDLGHVFTLLDTTRLGSAEWLRARIADFRAILHGTPAADPDQPVRLPGEAELAALARRRREGVAVAAADLAVIRVLAGAGAR